MTNTGFIEKTKAFFKSKRGELIISAVLSALALLFIAIAYSVRLSDYALDDYERADDSLWSASIIYIKSSLLPSVGYVRGLNMFFIIAFIAVLVMYLAAAAFKLLKKSDVLFYVASALSVLLGLAVAIVGSVLSVLRGGATACCVISMIFALAHLACLILRRKPKDAASDKAAYKPMGMPDARENGQAPARPSISPEANKKCRLAVFVCTVAALVSVAVAFFIPLYSSNDRKVSSIPIAAMASDASIAVTAVFVVMLIAFFALALAFISNLTEWLRADGAYIAKARRFVTCATVFTLIYFIVGFCLAFFFNIKGDDFTSGGEPVGKISFYTVSFIPLVISAVVLIVCSVFCGLAREDGQAKQTRKRPKLEPLIFGAVATAVTFLSLALNVVTVRTVINPFSSFKGYTNVVSLSGYKLLAEYKQLESGFQALAFLEAAILIVSGLLLVLSAIGYFAKDNCFYRLIKTSAVANFVFVLILGLFGLYFQIAQKVNLDNIKSLLALLKDNGQVDIPADAYTYTVTSQTIYMLIASFAVTAAMLFRGIFGLGAPQTATANGADDTENVRTSPADATAEPAATAAAAPADFDACPAFTELDGKRAQFDAELDARRQKLFAEPTLPNVVRFVVDYARECRLHLSYSAEDMATFVAGLGASRLTILQGMSGTGKTSLPKIFTEALMGNCEIVEVESSWRDKNELIGYYNEFSKCFTPKKFTQVLYKARLNPSVPTLIVLDEMNLSRIEYYFSDFLSLMENEEDKREFKLSNVKLFRTENGQKLPYSGLTDGHTVKIPTNVWFIGTANRDESTFAISDKVYDRAQTMNFDKRAPKIYSFGSPLEQRFLPYDALVALFDAAKSGYTFDAENNAAVQKTEKLLASYNISFGNRILRQIEDFVKIYCACFGDKVAAERDAVERILLSKVVSKLENKIVENREALAAEFDKAGLKSCGAFVRRLSED